MAPGDQVHFTAKIGEEPNQPVTWSVAEQNGGTIDGTGTYTAPSTVGDYTVVAALSGTTQSAKISVRRNVRVTVNPLTASLTSGGTLALTAAVSGTPTKSVTWTIAEAPAGGSVAADGTYTAPASAGVYHVVATSTADPTKSDTATITVTDAPVAPVPAPVAVAVSPQTASIVQGNTIQLSATVSNATNTGVTWSVAESGGGTVSATGLYTAPLVVGTFHVVATSAADSSKSATATITVTPTPATVAITVSPATTSLVGGNSAQFTATVTGTTNTSVSWTVQEGAAGGSVSSSGLYTSPSTAGTYHVVAQSVADPAQSARATVTVTAPAPAPTPTPTPAPAPAPTGPQFYVSTTGNDSNPGSQTQPWRTIQKAMNSATPGSTVNIAGGTYQERLTLNVSGTAGNYITFQNANFSPGASTPGSTPGGDTVVLDYSYMGTVTDTVPFLKISNRSYVRIQGLQFKNYHTSGGMQQGIRIDGSSSYIEIKYSKMMSCGEWFKPDKSSTAFLAVRMWSPSNNILFYGNEMGTVISSASEGVTVDGANAVTIEKNWLHDGDQIAISAYDGATNVTMRSNLVEYWSVRRDGSLWYGDGSNILYVNGTSNVIIERNEVRHSGWGVGVMSEPGQPSTHDITIRNNVFANNYDAGIEVGTWYGDPGPYNVYVYNNTSYGNKYGLYINPFQSATFENNIFANNTSGRGVNTTGSGGTGTEKYNLWSGNGGTSGSGSSDVFSSPLFTNAPGDLSLQAGSPALGAGDPGSTSMAGSVDFLGNPRVVNSRIDIGAYERP